jgi:steroid delta-isomerase-like uncharacterized protein
MSAATDLAKRFEHAFLTSDIDALAACYAEDAAQQHPFNPAGNHGREAIKAFEGGMFAAFSDIDFQVLRVIDGGEWASLEVVVDATNNAAMTTPTGDTVPATNKRISLAMLNAIRIDGDGLIAEEHRYFDVASMMGQLGLLG